MFRNVFFKLWFSYLLQLTMPELHVAETSTYRRVDLQIQQNSYGLDPCLQNLPATNNI